jgi:hypothetical protein
LYTDHPRYITSLPEGLLVAIPASGRQRLITKTFTAGNEPAETLMARAFQWRDRAWKRLFGTKVPARSFHQSARETSTTGIPGVRLTTKVVRKGQKRYEVPASSLKFTPSGQELRMTKGLSKSRLFLEQVRVGRSNRLGIRLAL